MAFTGFVRYGTLLCSYYCILKECRIYTNPDVLLYCIWGWYKLLNTVAKAVNNWSIGAIGAIISDSPTSPPALPSITVDGYIQTEFFAFVDGPPANLSRQETEFLIVSIPSNQTPLPSGPEGRDKNLTARPSNLQTITEHETRLNPRLFLQPYFLSRRRFSGSRRDSQRKLYQLPTSSPLKLMLMGHKALTHRHRYPSTP